MKRKAYEEELRKLQVELCAFAGLGEGKKLRVIILFEGRDAPARRHHQGDHGKISPRVSASSPSPRLPTAKIPTVISATWSGFRPAAKIVIFDRSWYNRAGVEHVMGFVDPDEHKRFLSLCPQMEKYIVDAGIILIKLWLEVGMEEQERRFNARIDDPMRQWKLSPMDIESYRLWYDYSRARDMMFRRRVQITRPGMSSVPRQAAGAAELHRHLLKTIPTRGYRATGPVAEAIAKGRYNDKALRGTKFVAERY